MPETTILIVDDQLDNLNLLSGILTQQGYQVRRAINGLTALKGAIHACPNLILLDINMPDMSGYEVCRSLKKDIKTCDIPVIFISALDEALDKVQAFSVGGVDYLPKPFEISELLIRVKNHLDLQAAKVEIQQLNTELEQRVITRTAELKAVNQALKQEILERQQVQEKLMHMALHDPLTDLPNRAYLLEQLEQAIERAHHQPNYQFGVLFIDCDRFKVVNDSLGHIMGDQLLIAIGQRLRTALPAQENRVARMGGDEFTLFLEEVDEIQDVVQVAHQIQRVMTPPFYLGCQEIFISASIGIVLGNAQYERPEHLLRDADNAMYRAKTSGQCYQVFDAEMHQQALDRLRLETDLRRAIEQQQLVLHYQPIVSLSTGQIVGFEALVRWEHPEQGMISPQTFIPVAEETGLILPLGLWVLQEACQQLKQWQDASSGSSSSVMQSDLLCLKMSVNLSGKQFTQPDLIDQIDRILRETGLNGHHLKLEITESALVENAELAVQLLQALKSRQIQLAIDDFGTGYSSLNYLYQFPIDTLKIDRSFIQGLHQSAEHFGASTPPCEAKNRLSLVQATINLAHHLGMDIVAEGIETDAQLAQLQAFNCEFGQGYLFAPPLDRQAAMAKLRCNPQASMTVKDG